MVKREFARVVGNDAAGVEDDALDQGALPELAPPGDVIADGIVLGDVGLAPAGDAAVPRSIRIRLGGKHGCARGAGEQEISSVDHKSTPESTPKIALAVSDKMCRFCSAAMSRLTILSISIARFSGRSEPIINRSLDMWVKTSRT